MKAFLLGSLIIVVVLSILLILTLNKTKNDMTIQLIREEVSLPKGDINYNLSINKKDTIYITSDGVGLFNINQQNRTVNIKGEQFTRIKSYIMDSGLLNMEINEFKPDHLPERFVRYTLVINLDNTIKNFKWIEYESNEFNPSIVPPLLLHLKEMIYCTTNVHEYYNVKCSEG